MKTVCFCFVIVLGKAIWQRSKTSRLFGVHIPDDIIHGYRPLRSGPCAGSPHRYQQSGGDLGCWYESFIYCVLGYNVMIMHFRTGVYILFNSGRYESRSCNGRVSVFTDVRRRLQRDHIRSDRERSRRNLENRWTRKQNGSFKVCTKYVRVEGRREY